MWFGGGFLAPGLCYSILGGFRRIQSDIMMPRPIKCGAELSDGNACDEHAIVTNIQYVYDRLPGSDGSDGYNLNEIHYNAVCPNCGDRKLIEKPQAD